MKKLMTITVVMMALLMIVASAASAATTQTSTVTLTGGAFTMVRGTDLLEFPVVPIADIYADNGDHTIYASKAPTFTVTDLRGNGAGWRVTFQITTLTNATYPMATPLNVGFTQPATVLANASGFEMNDPADTTNGPVRLVYNNQNLNSETRVVKAAEAHGKGVYDYVTSPTTSGNYKVRIQTDSAYIGDFTGTFTATLYSGPGGSGGWTGSVE